MGIKYERLTSIFNIYCVLSQKSICADECFSVKDGIIIKGQMLEPNCYLYGLQLVKNKNSKLDVGPSKIFINRDTSQFSVAIPNKAPFGTGVSLGMRKVHFYVQNSIDCNDIPYLNNEFTDNMVQFQKLELALVQTIQFNKIPERRNETMDKYLTAENYSFSKNNNLLSDNLNNNINSTVINSNINKKQLNSNCNTTNSLNTSIINNNNNYINNSIKKSNNITQSNSGGVLLEFDFNSKPTSGFSNNNINKPSPSNKGTFFNPNFLNKNTSSKNNIMNTIPEENSILISENNSNYNSLRKINYNLTGLVANSMNSINPNSAFNSNFSMIDSQIKNNIGSKLQQAELMRDANKSLVNVMNPGNSNGINLNINTRTNCGVNNNLTNQNNINSKATIEINKQSYFNNSINSNNNQSKLQSQKKIQTVFNPSNQLINQSQSSYDNQQLNNHSLRNSFNMQNISVGNINNTNISSLNKQINQNNLINSYSNTNNFNNIRNVQNVPTSNNFKSLLDVNNSCSMNFLNNNLQSIFLKESIMIINLNKIGNMMGRSMNNNIQQYTIIPQSRIMFCDQISDYLAKKTNHSNSNPSLPKNSLLQNMISQTNIKNQKQNLNCSNNIISKIFNNTSNKETAVSNLLNTNILNKSTVKFAGELRPRDKDSNIYTIDHYIFKEVLDQSLEKNFINSNRILNKNVGTEKIHSSIIPQSNNINKLNERILEKLGRKYLNDNENRGACNNNPVFEELYKTMSCYDILITIKNEDITAHKVVLISQSPVFKEMIELHENKMPNEIIKILLPESFKLIAFKEVLKWVYCGKISENFEIFFLRDILIIADSLKIYSLQKILIVKHIIPNMTKEASIKFLKDSYKKKTQNETAEVWNLLANFSLNCIAKNSSILLKNNRNEFLGMEMDLLFTCIERSVFYLVEEIHLSNLIKIIIDRGYATDVFDLLVQLSKNYCNARNVHIQNVDIKELMTYFDPYMPVEYPLINDVTALKALEFKQENEMAYVNNSNFNNQDNTEKLNNNLELAKNKIEIIDIKKLTSNSPATNYVKDVDIKKNKCPTFTFSFSINNSEENKNFNNKENIQPNISPCSLFSESFNTNSRSWNIKIDISSAGDVSFFLIERGPPLIPKDNNSDMASLYHDKFSLKFNSILFEFEIRDITFEKSCVIFYSFVSEHNQIVGYDNFYNIKQLGKKENFVFNIWIKEFPLHSACLQYVADNFQSLTVVNKIKKVEDSFSTIANSSTNIKSDQSALKTFYDLLPFDLAYILHSDYLKVDNENNVLTAVYRYTINKPSNDIDCVMNAIRYKFIDLKLLCTTARDHESIKNSNSFKKHFYRELDRKIHSVSSHQNDKECKMVNPYLNKKPKSILSEIKQDINYDNDNKIFDLNLAKNIENNSKELSTRQQNERKFYNFKDDRRKVFNITNELTSFFLDKDHHTGYIKEIERLKKLFEDEKQSYEKREAVFIQQKRDMQIEIQRLNERENKRRKLITTNSNNNPSLNNNLVNNQNFNGYEWVKNKFPNCYII